MPPIYWFPDQTCMKWSWIIGNFDVFFRSFFSTLVQDRRYAEVNIVSYMQQSFATHTHTHSHLHFVVWAENKRKIPKRQVYTLNGEWTKKKKIQIFFSFFEIILQLRFLYIYSMKIPNSLLVRFSSFSFVVQWIPGIITRYRNDFFFRWFVNGFFVKKIEKLFVSFITYRNKATSTVCSSNR